MTTHPHRLQWDHQTIRKFADRLYAIGKIENPRHWGISSHSQSALLDLAQAMYRISERKVVTIQRDELQRWNIRLSTILDAIPPKNRTSELYHEIQNIRNRFQRFLKDVEHYEESWDFELDPLTSTSILLGFTLWFGGSNFSLSYEEMSSELAFDHNKTIESSFRRLKGSAFPELDNKLIVLNARYSSEVDKAIFYLIGLGASLSIADPQVRRKTYMTIQEGFLTLTGNKYHPMVRLFDNIRGYVSDYCQRFFGRIYTELEKKESRLEYGSMRRFVIRLSLLPVSDFVVSGDAKIQSIVKNLEASGAVKRMRVLGSKEVLLIKREVLKH